MLHATQSMRHALRERGADLYETPPVAVEALLRAEQLPHRLWEPACGRGSIVNVLRAAGHDVLASDLADYNNPTQFHGRDFLMERLPTGVEAIVTNPPYFLAEKFVEHALDVCPFVCMLLRLAFYEVCTTGVHPRGRRPRAHPRLRKRLPMMHSDQWAGPKASSAICFAWFVWDRAHEGPTTIDRISWEA